MGGEELIEHDRLQMARLGRTRRTDEEPDALERWMHAGTGSASPHAGQAKYRRSDTISQASGTETLLASVARCNEKEGRALAHAGVALWRCRPAF